MRTATPLATWRVITEAGWSATSAAISTPAVDGPGVHDQGAVGQQAGPFSGEPVGGGVLAQGREQGFDHSFVLQAEEVDDIQLGQDGVEVVGHLDRPAHQGRREQGGRGDQGHLGAQAGEGQHVGAGHPAVPDVADDGNLQTVQRRATTGGARAAPLALLADGVAVEERLGGCSCQPSPALMTEGPCSQRATCHGTPDPEWRTTTRSIPMASMVSTVSRSDSPLLTDELDAEKVMTSAERRRAAVSKLSRVRVESSKNNDTTVLPRSAGTRGMARELTSTKLSVRCRTSSIPSAPRSVIDSRWRVILALRPR